MSTHTSSHTTVADYLREQIDQKLNAAETIVTAASKSHRSVTGAERAEIDKLLEDAQSMKDRVKELRQRDELAASIEKMRNGPGPSGSFAQSMITAGLHPKANPSVKVSAVGALGVKAPDLTDAPGGDWNITAAGTVPLGQDRRWIYGNLRTVDAGDATSVSDFRITDRTVTGTVQRAQSAVTEKAKLSPTIEHVTEAVPQHAVVLDGIPLALLTAIEGMRQVLDGEGRYVVQSSLDTHVYDQLAEDAPFGNTGTGLIQKARHAVAAMRASGANPDLLVLDPADAVTLDLETDDGGYIFATRDTGSSSPLFGLRVVESVAADGEDPLLVDSQMVGQLYLGGLQVDTDPFAGADGKNFVKNLVDVRFELSAYFHVQNPAGAYRIGTAG
jgi:hypothetical protein